jgi:hypothetical protein
LESLEALHLDSQDNNESMSEARMEHRAQALAINDSPAITVAPKVTLNVQPSKVTPATKFMQAPKVTPKTA